MEITDFKLTKNKQRPEFCYCYKRYDADKKYEIFTMNGGVSFLASIESLTLKGNYTPDFSKNVVSIEDALFELNNFQKPISNQNIIKGTGDVRYC